MSSGRGQGYTCGVGAYGVYTYGDRAYEGFSGFIGRVCAEGAYTCEVLAYVPNFGSRRRRRPA